MDPSTEDSVALRLAAARGHLSVVDRLLQDDRVDPSANINYAIQIAAQNGHLAVVERLMQDERVDPSADENCALRWAAENGHHIIVDRLLERVDPSVDENYILRWAIYQGHDAVSHRLIEDERIDAADAFQHFHAQDLKKFEFRDRLSEVCIALQDLRLPAWVTMKICQAARPWSTLPIHAKWNLVCTVKHFHDKKQ